MISASCRVKSSEVSRTGSLSGGRSVPGFDFLPPQLSRVAVYTPKLKKSTAGDARLKRGSAATGRSRRT